MGPQAARQIVLDSENIDKIEIEIIYKSDFCLSCCYMEQALEEVLPEFEHLVKYRRVDLAQSEGKERFLELSISIFGEDGVYRKALLAPIPSMFINGELYFDAVPPRFELEEAILEASSKKNPGIQVDRFGSL